MKIEVDVDHWYDWRLRHKDAVRPEDVSIPSHHGEDLRLVRELQPSPSVTEVNVPDSDIQRMAADHAAGVELARAGYTCVQEGGDRHGHDTFVPSRLLPARSWRRLLAEHLAVAVMPAHAEAEHVTGVRVVQASLPEEERADLERFLTAYLAEGRTA